MGAAGLLASGTMTSRALGLALAFFVFGCSSGSNTGTGGAGGGGTSSSTATTSTATGMESCTATFHWLQKDAYNDTAGRSSDLWPPHTTTQLDLSCDGVAVQSAFMANHGTEPGAKDKNGDVFLVEVKKAEAPITRAEMLGLMTAYQSCECDPTTKFLSMDSLSDALAKQLLTDVQNYVGMHLTCSITGGTPQLLMDLQAGNIAQVIADLPMCTWDNGTGFADGLDKAFQALVAQTSETLQNYHVCNNDATLQAKLFDTFTTTHQVAPCDMTSSVCHGPLWFYKP